MHKNAYYELLDRSNRKWKQTRNNYTAFLMFIPYTPRLVVRKVERWLLCDKQLGGNGLVVAVLKIVR